MKYPEIETQSGMFRCEICNLVKPDVKEVIDPASLDYHCQYWHRKLCNDCYKEREDEAGING